MSKITLEEGLKIVRWIESQLIPLGAHCALGGSVLHKGESQKDIDIFVYPHNEPNPKNQCSPKDLELHVRNIFPAARLVTDTNYPHDRLLYRVDMFGIRIELFIFVR